MSFGENSIKIDLNQIQASRKQFQKEKSVNFQGKIVSRVTPKGFGGCTWLQKWQIFKKRQLFFQKKLYARIAPMQKWFKGWEFFYEDSNIWITYVQKRILLCIFREKLWIFKKSIHRLAKLASLLKRGQRGYFYPWGAFFPLFYTKRSVLGSKIGGFLMILMSISSCKLMLHVILVFPKFINSIFTPAQEF